jgi:hypothetical protein
MYAVFNGSKILKRQRRAQTEHPAAARSPASKAPGSAPRIELSLRSGRKVTLGRTIRNKKEVDWLIEEMNRLTGLQPKSMTTGAV